MAAKYSVDKVAVTENVLTNLSDGDNPEDSVYYDLIVAKVVSIIILGVVSFLIGLLPLQLSKWFNLKFTSSQCKGKSGLVISLLLCFGGGVLMFTTFIHLQPEVREELEELIHEGKAPDFENFADLVFCAGFFFVYLIEEVVHGILDRKHDHSNDETCLHRTVSLRRCNKGKEQSVEDSCNQGIIPRVSLTQNNDVKPLDIGSKSNSTQVLIESGNRNGTTTFEQNYPSKFSSLDPETQITGGNYCLHSDYPKVNEKNGDSFDSKDFHSARKTSPTIHSHTHGLFEDDSNLSTSGESMKFANTFRGLFTVLALSFHAVFEGLAVGLENEVTNVWYLFMAIATHKFVISFCVGVDLLSTKTKTSLIMLYLGTFAFVTPLGIGIGIALSNDPTKSTSELSTVILQGMAAGTLLYVVFFEVLSRERANEQSGILQLIAIALGFGVMLALQLASKY